MLRKKQNLVVLFIGISVIGLLASSVNTTSFEKKPNIVLIMTDDVSVSMVDFLLGKKMMPNLQENIIESGTAFTNSFVSSPLCCPSRATTLTGLYPHNHGILFNQPVFINETHVVKGGFEDFNDTSTLATWLQKEGWETGFIGKYMNGYGYDTSSLYIPPGWDHWISHSIPTNRMINFGINDNGHRVIINDQYRTDYYAKEASNFINNSESPFFLYVSTLVAHSTRDSIYCEDMGGGGRHSILVSSKYKDSIKNFQFPFSPSFNETDVSDKNPIIKAKPSIKNTDCIEKQFKDRTESLRSVDDLIGTVYSTLVNTGKLNNTIIIFTSDNGILFGEHRHVGKIHPFEESIRVPLFIRAPGFEKQIVEQLVINNDLAPTILDFAGLDHEISLDGLSLVPLMKEPSSSFREDFLVEVYYEGRKEAGYYHALRGQNFLYVEFRGTFNFTEYYDLKHDPFQLSNLAECVEEECIKKLEKLSMRLDELKKCGNGSC